MTTLRPYQTKTLEAIRSNYLAGVRQQLVSAATGTGKTVTFSQIPPYMKDLLTGQTLVLAHRFELIDQAIEKIRLANPALKVSKEMASSWADCDSDVIVASVATLGRKDSERSQRFDWNKITTVITDEAHHATAQSYQNIYELADVVRKDTHRLHVGMTATPNRSDGTGLAKVFHKIVYSYGMRQAKDDGYLSDVKGIRVKTETSLDGVKMSGGDFSQEELSDRVNNPARNQTIVKAWLDKAAGLRTVVFAVDIQHSRDLAAMFRHYGVKAEALWGDDPDRAEKLAKHRNGEIDVLINCAVLVEGYDDPGLQCVIIARPTRSSVFFTQAIGRGTRLFAGKTHCLVIDVVDASSRLSLLTLPTLMGMSANLDLRGQSMFEAVKKLEDAAKDYPAIDFSQLTDITQLQTFIEDTNLFEISFPKEVTNNSDFSWFTAPTGGYVLTLPKPKESHWSVVPDKITVIQNLLDKWEVSGSIKGKKYKGERESIEEAFAVADKLLEDKCSQELILLRRHEEWHDTPASEKQLRYLAKLIKKTGKAIPPGLTSGAASKLIGSLKAGK